MENLFSEPMFILFAILALGSWIGRWSFRGVSLGAAGVLFVGLVFGHFGFEVPRAVMELGLLLFVYAVGLSAGPRFFRTFRRRGIQFVVIAFASVATGALVTLGVAYALRLDYALAAGLYAGAMTCTPALAAAIDAIERVAPGMGSSASVGYGIAYPFSMIGVVLLIQFMPRLLRRDLSQAENAWLQEKQAETPGLQARQYRITNPNCAGKTVSDINPHRMSLANISRIKRGKRVFAAERDAVLQMGDVVMVVGTPAEQEKMQFLLGEEVHENMDDNTRVISLDVEITQETICGKPLGSIKIWERYMVVITRIRRQGLEITPIGTATLEMGDTIRVVGNRDAVDTFANLARGGAHKADETNMVPFLAGLLLGICAGLVPIPLGNGISVKLGMAGGAFMVSLLIAHFGRIGPLRFYAPVAARNLSRELGLMLFLAGAGVNAGARFVSILQQQGPGLLIGGALITTLSVIAGIVMMDRFYRMNILATMGALCACMTNPPGMNAANAQTEMDLPAVSYASVYPVALIFKILLAQVLVQILSQ
ncbi:MAG: aspartate:alanine exchanger family transporter [Chloroflexota bacterium]